MRKKQKETAVYHCQTWVKHAGYPLDAEGREVFQEMLWKVAAFSGVEVLAYCILPRWVHLLVRVPAADEAILDDKTLLERYAHLYDQTYRGAFPRPEVLALIFEDGDTPEANRWRQRLKTRMHDISGFMKTLKQRYSWWYNKAHLRNGSFWAERFRMEHVEADPATLPIRAAFLDLYPVRAQLAEDPADYPWSSFGEAARGGTRAQAGLASVVGQKSWDMAEPIYTNVIYGEAESLEAVESVDLNGDA